MFRRWLVFVEMMETLPLIPIFQDIEPSQREILKDRFEQFDCHPETVIFKQGDPASHLYILIKGEVAIHYKPYDGASIILTRLRNGDVFGWSAAVGSAKYTSSIIAESNIESVRIKKRDLHSLIQDHPVIGKILIDRLANIVSSRWKNAHEQVESILKLDRTDE